MTVSVGLDTSCGSSIAIARDGEILLNEQFTSSGRQNDSELIPWLLQCLQRLDLTPNDVDQWSCGIGPGSYSGIRVGISWVKGICLASQKPYRGISGSYACASAITEQQPQAQRIAILHDGRRRQLIISAFTKHNQQLVAEEPQVYDLQDAIPLLENMDAIGTIQEETIAPLLPEAITQKLIAFPVVPAAYLLNATIPFASTIEEQDNSCEPIYVRPAVFVNPKEVRIVNQGNV